MESQKSVDVYNPKTDKVAKRAVFGIVTKDGLQVGCVRMGNAWKQVYFSTITNRWCLA